MSGWAHAGIAARGKMKPDRRREVVWTNTLMNVACSWFSASVARSEPRQSIATMKSTPRLATAMSEPRKGSPKISRARTATSTKSSVTISA